MKMPLMLFALAVSLHVQGSSNPFVDGAESDVEVVVRDEAGLAIPQASLKVAFLVAPYREVVRQGVTDANGRFRASCSTCIGGFSIRVAKDGYYEAFARRQARAVPEEVVFKTQKWSDGLKSEEIILRPIRHPAPMMCHDGIIMRYPATNEVLRFDLERFDWCSPYGLGKKDDVSIVFEAVHSPTKWSEFVNNIHVTFPNGADGFYKKRIECPDSAYKYAYEADVHAKYEKRLDLYFGRTEDTVTNDVRLAKDEYLIYRIRTQTNECGKVTSAHYGMLREGFGHLLGLTMASQFNPKPDDPNLEDETFVCRQRQGGRKKSVSR